MLQTFDVVHWCEVYASLDYKESRSNGSRSRSRRYGLLVASCIREWGDQRFKVVSVEQEKRRNIWWRRRAAGADRVIIRREGDITEGQSSAAVKTWWYYGGTVTLRRESRLSKPKTTLNRLWVSIISYFLFKTLYKSAMFIAYKVCFFVIS